MNSVIELARVSWRPGPAFALQELDLRVPEGSIYGFLGPNGSGKSSTIRILMGMLKADAGRVRLLGRPAPDDLPEILQEVGYMPERPHLFNRLTVREAVAFHRAFYRRWDQGWADSLLRRMELNPDQVIRRLSKGETGKLMFTLALASRPRLLILDEPTDGLDPVVRRDMVTTLLDYVSREGASVFISSHLVHELERICDWVGVIDDGRLVAELRMEDFKNSIKRIRLGSAATPPPPDVPFAVLDRIAPNGVSPLETWVVWGWQAGHREHLSRSGIDVRDVIDLDLEEGFVALLRSTRKRTPTPGEED